MCRALSTEKAVHKNKHKNKAFLISSFLISVIPVHPQPGQKLLKRFL
jgi:hypothetical protein